MSKKPILIKGYLFPVPHKFVSRLFSGKKDVFVKLSRRRLRFLAPGNSLLFYDSGSHEVVGEARIKEILYVDTEVIWKKLGSRIFLQRKEFTDYVARSPLGPRKNPKKMTAFVLEKIIKYSTPKKPQKRVTPAGYYLRAE